MDVVYTLCGYIHSTPSTTQRAYLTGVLTIDDTLRGWEASSTAPAPPVILTDSHEQYSFFIPDYAIDIYSLAPSTGPNQRFSMTGRAGCLYIERHAPPGQASATGDLMWFLEAGTGDWMKWIGEQIQFYDANLSVYDLSNHLAELAPVIRLSGLAYVDAIPEIDVRGADLLLTRRP